MMWLAAGVTATKEKVLFDHQKAIDALDSSGNTDVTKPLQAIFDRVGMELRMKELMDAVEALIESNPHLFYLQTDKQYKHDALDCNRTMQRLIHALAEAKEEAK